MGRKNEFPELKAIGLYAADTVGNGNCLFNALSDQLYGDQSCNTQLRDATVEYMKNNPDRFKSFLVVHPGGGSRRNPKRKNHGSLATSTIPAGPTPEEVDAAYKQHMKTMAKTGVYGDNLEIIAFAQAFKVDIMIFSEGGRFFYYVRCEKAEGEMAPMLCIVHHAWEHYSSIRNAVGPHSGPPNVNIAKSSAEAEAEMNAELANFTYVKPWMVDEVMRSLPFLTDRAAIEKALQDYKGNVDSAVSSLMPESSQSSGGSSSIERDAGSDEDMEQKPTKKQNRRPSRPQPLGHGKPQQNLTVRTKEANTLSPDPMQLSAALTNLKGEKSYDPDETEEEDWRNDSTYKDSESASVSTSASDYSAAPKAEPGPIRLRLSQPKKQADEPPQHSSNSSVQSNIGDYDADAEKPQKPRVIAKPRKRLISRDERDRLASLKAARLAGAHPNSALYTATQKQNQNTPVIDMGIKVLHI